MATTTKKQHDYNSKIKNRKNGKFRIHEFFVDELKDITGEQHLSKALPKRKKQHQSRAGLRFEKHTEEPNPHINFRTIFELLGEKAQAKKWDSMEGW